MASDRLQQREDIAVVKRGWITEGSKAEGASDGVTEGKQKGQRPLSTDLYCVTLRQR